MNTLARSVLLGVLLAGAATSFAAEPLAGRWDAQLVRANDTVPFRLDLSGEGASLKGVLYDGFRPSETTSAASSRNGTVVLRLDHYLTTISARLDKDRLVGEVTAKGRSGVSRYGFTATRHRDDPVPATSRAPDLAGQWEMPLPAPNSLGEKAYRLSVEQRGNELAAAILRVDGDTGAYSGTFQDGRWRLSHYDGSRAGVLLLTPQADGTLSLEQSGSPTLVAYRSEVARARGLPAPADVLANTRARDPREQFTFSFRDVDGTLRSQDDPYFKGKVIVAIITGTWCPNCHDEAKYMVQLDARYRKRGLRIVALDFEEAEQQGSLERVRAFTRQYGVTYPYLIAGAPEELGERIPQLVNLNTWPATVFVGRDGTVRAVHAGFASPATGALHAELQQEYTRRIEALLAEK